PRKRLIEKPRSPCVRACWRSAYPFDDFSAIHLLECAYNNPEICWLISQCKSQMRSDGFVWCVVERIMILLTAISHQSAASSGTDIAYYCWVGHRQAEPVSEPGMAG